MWFPTIVIVVVGITQIESRDCSELSSVTNLKIARTDSSLTIEWTASNSAEECLEGYELCLSAISFENTNTTCYNVSKNETSFSSNDDIYYCVNYKATVTVLGADGLKLRSSYGSLEALAPTTIDSTMIQSVSVDNVTASGATISWEPVYKDSPCALHYSVCYLEDDSAGSPGCYTMINTSDTAIKLPYLKCLTNYTVNVSAVFLDKTTSSVVTTAFRTSGAVKVVVSSMMLTMILFIASL
uniref:Fibronectin type-III domain-containing protein n=1 Tax=Timema bartmani TaxID=61472 RepID=A0A7R9F576_9NEOP|nr:unnamed protein product [Timema bartmani]